LTDPEAETYDNKVLNFSKYPFSNLQGHKAIILKSKQKTIINSAGLYFNETIDPMVPSLF